MDNNMNTGNSASKKENKFVKALKTGWKWLRRMVLGASKELSEEDIFTVEKLESPGRMAVKAFFRRKLAVGALCVLIALFLFVFIGPFFFPIDLNYIDPLQANLAPNMSMRSVPSGLKNNVRTISGVSNFTVGVSSDSTLYMWGATKLAGTNIDLKDFDPAITEGNVYTASAGSDFVIAVTNDGRMVGWGNNSRGQFGRNELLNTDDPVILMPEKFMNEKIDPEKIDFLLCGYQCVAFIYDGELYMWGNTKACINMKEIMEHENEDGTVGYKNVSKVSLSNYYAVLLMDDGTIVAPGGFMDFMTAESSSGKKVEKILPYANSASLDVVDIAATNNSYGFLLSNGEVLICGDTNYGVAAFPTIAEGEKVISIASGTRHYVAKTDKNTVYAWGHNDVGQSNVKGISAGDIFPGAKQTYVVSEEGKLIKSVGTRGYVFGTDNLGRDTFSRIVHGGKMTMTIGAVAVIVSTIIAIIVGCVSGYFGGWVDMLLMRITEIFSAIPFLPFAMMLSYVIATKDISETMRIFIIMMILGLLSWTGLAHMIRAQVLAEREKEFVIAAQAMGIKEKRIAFRHILPNVISTILVSVTLDFAGCLLTESSLSYLGFGVQQPRPTWGNMLNGANNSIVIKFYWWQWLFPAIFLAIATISINIIGDTLRDVFDPKSSQEK